MTSETERELVEYSCNEKFTEHDGDGDENGGDDDDSAVGRQEDASGKFYEGDRLSLRADTLPQRILQKLRQMSVILFTVPNLSADPRFDQSSSGVSHPEKNTSRTDQSSVLQSTPVNGSPPTRESNLPSAIKSLPEGDRGIRKSESPTETRQRKSIFSMLSSIAEKSFNSPRRTKQPPPHIDDEILVDAAINENDSSIGSSGSLLETPLTNDHRRVEPQCKCTSCKDAFAVVRDYYESIKAKFLVPLSTVIRFLDRDNHFSFPGYFQRSSESDVVFSGKSHL